MTEDQLKEYAKYLTENGFDVIVSDGYLQIQIKIESYICKLKCILGKHFPYEVPSIYIDEESKSQLPTMPHMFTDNGICLYDKGRIIPNFKKPELLIEESINTAINILSVGIKGENKQDYTDEFLEYWSVKSKFTGDIFIDFQDDIQQVNWYVDDGNIYVSDRIETIDRIVNLSTDKEEMLFKTGIFIPIAIPDLSVIPKNDLDIIKLIHSNSKCYEVYDSFMKRNKEKFKLVVLKLISASGMMIIGWLHLPLKENPTGFRDKNIDTLTAYQIKENQSGKAVSLNDCSNNRLFFRGGDGISPIWKKVTVIGCGSVGSFIVESLRYHGTEVFNLIDNEIFVQENIARHVLGYSYCGIPKVKGLQYWLEKANPNTECMVFKQDAHDFIEEQQPVMNDSDVVIVAVASVPVEYHINKLIMDKRIQKPVLIMWVEPYMAGGHAVYLKQPQNMYDEVFNPETFEFLHPIVLEADKYLKREAGCQSSFMPYSGFMLQQYVNRILDCILHECNSKKGNYLITWIGNKKDSQLAGVKISEEYSQLSSYSVITRRID